MTKEQTEFLKNATEYAGNQEIDLREDYSGRDLGFKEIEIVEKDGRG